MINLQSWTVQWVCSQHSEHLCDGLKHCYGCLPEYGWVVTIHATPTATIPSHHCSSLPTAFVTRPILLNISFNHQVKGIITVLLIVGVPWCMPSLANVCASPLWTQISLLPRDIYSRCLTSTCVLSWTCILFSLYSLPEKWCLFLEIKIFLIF